MHAFRNKSLSFYSRLYLFFSLCHFLSLYLFLTTGFLSYSRVPNNRRGWNNIGGGGGGGGGHCNNYTIEGRDDYSGLEGMLWRGLTFSRIELQMLFRCCIIILRHFLHLLYLLCPYLALGVFMLHLCDLFFISIFIFITISCLFFRIFPSIFG